MKRKLDDIKIPTKYRGGMPEEAYRAGYAKGHDDKALTTLGISLAVESITDMARNGMEHFDALRVMKNFGEKVERHLTFAERIDRFKRGITDDGGKKP